MSGARSLLPLLTAVLVSGCAVTAPPDNTTASHLSIAEDGFVSIRGLEQWITIEGDDRSKPVLLVLHGGPGQAESFLTGRMRAFEHDFVVVNWDQRGAGRTLARAGGKVDPAIDLKTMVADGLQVSEYLREHLHRRQIVLVGFSWGSRLGVEMAEARPDLFSAYVGTGQAAEVQTVSDAWVYAHLLEQAQRAGDKRLSDALQSAGSPPWTGPPAQRLYQAATPYRGTDISPGEALKAASAAGWGPSDIQALVRGRSAYKVSQLERDITAFDPASFGRRLRLPVIIIDGHDDLTTPPPLARRWLEGVPATRKVFKTIPGAGHQVMLTHGAQFNEALLEGLRP